MIIKIITLPLALLMFVASAMAQVSINPVSRSVPKDGGGAAILTSGTGSWTATTADSWITITPRTTGTAGESCIYLVAANFSADIRQGTIDVEGNIHTVNQTGYAVTVSPTSTTVEYEGGGGQISVAADAGVSWTAVANDDWASVTPASGISAGSVSYTVAPYAGVTPRTTSLTIAGQTFSVTQNGQDVNITPRSVEKGHGSDIIQIQVAALWDTSWSVTPNASWISVVDPGAGAGDFTVTLAIGSNPSYQHREGTVAIGSATFTVSQLGTPTPILAINPPEATAEPVGAYGNVAVLATPDAPWSAESLAPWVIIADGEEGAGNGNIQYVVSSNPTLSDRTGRIRVYPPVYEARSDLSRQLFAHVKDGDEDVSGWNRDLTGSLTRRFDGIQPWAMTGQDFYRDDDAFTFSFWFNIGSPDTINRLMGVTRAASSYSAVYIDASNYLIVQCDSEILVTNLLIEPDVEYQVVVTADGAQDVKVYAGKRNDMIAEVGSKTFSVDPFPMNYVTPSRISVGKANLPSLGNLTDATINDFRVYGRDLSAYEAEKLFEVAGTSAPYGDFSHNGDADNVRVEYNLQGQALVAGGSYPSLSYPSTTDQFFTQYQGFSTSEQTVHTLNLGAERVDSVRGDASTYGGSSSASYAIYWRFEFVYVDGTSHNTPWRSKAGGSASSTEPNPYPQKLVTSIRVKAYRGYYDQQQRLTTYVLLPSEETRELVAQAPSTGRLSLAGRSLLCGESSAVLLRNHQSSFSSSSATYNFWMRFDSLNTSSLLFTRNIMGGNVFSCTVLSNGSLRFKLNDTIRDYPASLQEGEWHMITVAGDYGGSTKFYVDGGEIGNTPDFGTYKFGANTSRNNLSIRGWEGAIDYAGFYDGQLSSPAIKAIYDAQKPQEVYHTVTQGAIAPSIAPENGSVPAAGGTISTDLTLALNVSWTAAANDSWLSITSPTTGAGSTTVDVLADANPTVYQRQGTITVAGEDFTVDQAGLGSSVSDADTVFGTDGGSGWIDVSTEGNAQWQAVSQVSWLTVAIGDTGTGAGSIFIVVDPYTQTSSSRIGAVVIAGHTVYFTQRGFELSISPQVAQVGSNAGAGEFGVAAPVGAIWEAITTHPWISIMGSTSGQGNGTLRYSVGVNTTGASRTGKIIVAGQEYTLTQTASLLLTAYTDGGGTVTGSGDYETLATASLSATPDAGYMFSHWSGDAVGSDNPLSLSMDSSKSVKGHFIAEALADTIALNSKERLGLYDTDQMHGLALGKPVLELDPATGKMCVLIGLETVESLSDDWSDIVIDGADVFIQGGKVRVEITPNGNAAFYRLQGDSNE